MKIEDLVKKLDKIYEDRNKSSVAANIDAVVALVISKDNLPEDLSVKTFSALSESILKRPYLTTVELEGECFKQLGIPAELQDMLLMILIYNRDIQSIDPLRYRR